jgi:hypothetical protein
MESEIFDLIAVFDDWEYELPEAFLEETSKIIDIMLVKIGYVPNLDPSFPEPCDQS